MMIQMVMELILLIPIQTTTESIRWRRGFRRYRSKDSDSDDDGINDGDEFQVVGSNPLDSDSDGDGLD